MEVILSGAEVHVLRELLDVNIVQIGKEGSRIKDSKVLDEIRKKEKVLKAILEKLPVEFTTA